VTWDERVSTDGTTVWVDDGTGYCLGRFGRMGIDVHVPPTPHAGTECLYCTHETTTPEDWRTFVEKMQHHHGVTIPENAMPKRFR
jgi:hypothetical protein